MNETTFYKITNAQIYHEVLALRKDFGTIRGRVKLNTWISTTALGLFGLVLGVLLK